MIPETRIKIAIRGLRIRITRWLFVQWCQAYPRAEAESSLFVRCVFGFPKDPTRRNQDRKSKIENSCLLQGEIRFTMAPHALQRPRGCASLCQPGA
jgi:hypothetical protein